MGFGQTGCRRKPTERLARRIAPRALSSPGAPPQPVTRESRGSHEVVTRPWERPVPLGQLLLAASFQPVKRRSRGSHAGVTRESPVRFPHNCGATRFPVYKDIAAQLLPPPQSERDDRLRALRAASLGSTDYYQVDSHRFAVKIREFESFITSIACSFKSSRPLQRAVT